MYDMKALYEAHSVEEAVALRLEHPEAQIIAGGSDVLVQMREGKRAGAELISIYGIDAMRGIRIGSLTSFSHITRDPIIRKYINVLGEAVDMVGGPQIRNIGTIGGNVCNGVTSADSASSLCCLDAILVVEGPEGVREIPIREWYTGPGKTVRKHDEILTAIKIKKESYEGFGGHYIKYGKRNAMEIATMGCAVTVKLTGDKKHIEEIHIGYGVAAPTPIRCFKAEEKVKGMEIGNELFETLGKSVLEEVNPRTSWRASKEFRLQLIEEMAKRALKQAIINAGGECNA